MEKLIKDIKKETIDTSYFTGVMHLNSRTLKAFKSVDRALFVLEKNKSSAYDDCPLPIGHGQTISQPFIVALMTDLLDVKPEHKVLEVGSGSGYQLAILAKLAQWAYGIELIPELCEHARENLKNASVSNATVIAGDGTQGMPEQAPFDRIMVSAAANEVPLKLLEQLVIGGIMVVPKKISAFDQMLMRITKSETHELITEDILAVRFVPLINS